MSKHALFSDLSSLLNYLLTMYFGPDEERMGAFENGFFFFFFARRAVEKNPQRPEPWRAHVLDELTVWRL